MWSASCAPRELAGAGLDDEAYTRPAQRALRVARLLTHLGRIWAAAIVGAGRLERDRHYALKRRYAGMLLEALGLHLAVRGDPPPYDEPMLVVANHTSWIDPYALNCVTGARFVAKAEVSRWPVVGRSARGFGAFFIERGSCRSAARVKDGLAAALRGREPVGAFPESTTTDGTRLLRFYPAMFQAAIDAGAMVQPVAIRYRTASGRPTAAAAFIDDMTAADSLRRMLPLRTIVAELTFCPPLVPRARSRRALAADARELIGDALQLPRESETGVAPYYPLSRKAA